MSNLSGLVQCKDSPDFLLRLANTLFIKEFVAKEKLEIVKDYGEATQMFGAFRRHRR